MDIVSLAQFEDWLYFQNSYAKASMYRACYRLYASTYKTLSTENAIAFMRGLHEKVQQEQLSASAYNNYLKSLRLLFKCHGMPDNLPINKKKTEKSYITTLEDTEALQVKLMAYKGSNFRYAVALHLLLEHGLRIHNVINLRWDDVHDEAIYICKTKMNNAYTIQPMTELLQNMQQLRGNDDTYVFGKNNCKLHKSNYNKYLKRVCTACGITKNITAHKLRHTNATMQAERGVNIKIISENLGHTSIKSTENYIHASEKAKREAIKKLGLSKYKISKQEIVQHIQQLVTTLQNGECEAYYVQMQKNIVVTVPM